MSNERTVPRTAPRIENGEGWLCVSETIYKIDGLYGFTWGITMMGDYGIDAEINFKCRDFQTFNKLEEDSRITTFPGRKIALATPEERARFAKRSY
jgi:hypothetical protein